MLVKASVLGHFGEGVTLLNGQTVKTKIITEELQRQFGDREVIKIDTHGGLKTLFKAPLQVFKALQKSKNVLIFPAQNGLRVYAPLLGFMKSFFKKRKLHYVVIGGWLSEFLKDKASLAKCLKKFDGIYVETNTMKKALEKMGFCNIFVMPNCKELKILEVSELVYPKNEPYKLCTFSRVMKEKGIEDAVNAVKKVNEALDRTIYQLDIYGQVDANQTEWFENLRSKFPEYVHYCGCVDSSKSVEILKDCYVLLFPTHFYTEGIPGTIIDAYAAGIPVISARWESYADIIDEGKTGISFEFDNQEQFTDILLRVANDTKILLNLKENCIKCAKKYIPETAIKVIISQTEGE